MTPMRRIPLLICGLLISREGDVEVIAEYQNLPIPQINPFFYEAHGFLMVCFKSEEPKIEIPQNLESLTLQAPPNNKFKLKITPPLKIALSHHKATWVALDKKRQPQQRQVIVLQKNKTLNI